MRKEAWCKKGRPEAPIINPPPFFETVVCLSPLFFLLLHPRGRGSGDVFQGLLGPRSSSMVSRHLSSFFLPSDAQIMRSHCCFDREGQLTNGLLN